MARINNAGASFTVDMTGTTAVGPYRFRSSKGTHRDSLRISGNGTWTGTMNLVVCNPGQAAASGAVDTAYAASDATSFSAPFYPGSSCDIYFVPASAATGSISINVYR